jgi:hypothetical protein
MLDIRYTRHPMQAQATKARYELDLAGVRTQHTYDPWLLSAYTLLNGLNVF